jgi:hypothetical protein
LFVFDGAEDRAMMTSHDRDSSYGLIFTADVAEVMKGIHYRVGSIDTAHKAYPRFIQCIAPL